MDQTTDGVTPWKTAYLVGKQMGKDNVERVMFIILRDDTLQLATFMEPRHAEELAGELIRIAAEIRTGIVMPHSSRVEIANG